MSKTPGIIFPSSFPSTEALNADLQRRDDDAGFTPFDPQSFLTHTDIVQEILEHHGIKGMHWGIRKQVHVQPGAKGERLSADFKKTVPLRNRKTKHLTNKQLQTVNTRINLEKNYNSLNPSTITKGHNLAKSYLAIAGTAATAYYLVNSAPGQAAISAGKHFIRTAKILKMIK